MSNPINRNLNIITLPTQESTAFTKVLIVGDSQSLRTEERWVGQTQKWDMQHEGAFLHSVSNSSVGQSFSSNPDSSDYGATITRSSILLGSDWGDANTSDHLQHSYKWDVAGTISPNFSNLATYRLSAGGYTNAIDLDTRKNSRTIIRDAAGTFARVRIAERRGSTTGQSDDFGISGDPVVFDGSDVLRILNWPIRPAGTFGTAGNAAGIAFKDSNNADTNRDVQVLGTLIYNSPTGEDFPSTGLLVANTARGSWAADDFISGQSAAAREAIIEVAEGYDLVIFMFGHNAESSGTYSDNMNTLINAWKSAHTSAGYAVPDILCIAPWNADAANSMTAQKASDLLTLCIQNDYGYISLWDSYDGLTPEGRTTRLDGVAVTSGYELDGGVHPNAEKDAIAFAKDIEWHFQPENWFIPTPTSGSIRTISLRAIPSNTPAPSFAVNGRSQPTRFIDTNVEDLVDEIVTRSPAVISFGSVSGDLEIRYTTNNKNPTSKSKLYDGPIVLNRNLTGSDNTVIKARIFHKNNPNIKSRIVRLTVKVF